MEVQKALGAAEAMVIPVEHFGFINYIIVMFTYHVLKFTGC